MTVQSNTWRQETITKKRRQHSAQFKFQVALAAAKGDKTISQLASETGVHPSQIGAWKRQLLDNGDELFSHKNGKTTQDPSAQEAELYEQIGRLKMELEWLKKKLPPSLDAKRAMIEPEHLGKVLFLLQPQAASPEP